MTAFNMMKHYIHPFYLSGGSENIFSTAASAAGDCIGGRLPVVQTRGVVWCQR